MNLSLDPKTTALVLIDLQRGIVGRELAPHSSSIVVRNSVLLADALRSKGGPVIFIWVLMLALPVDAPSPRGSTSPPPEASELVPETNAQPGDLVVAKRQWGAFYETGPNSICATDSFARSL